MYVRIVNMQEIIEIIREAEAKAAEIKANALEKAAAIVAAADGRASDIERLAEAECKALREKALKEATEEAQRRYDEQITVRRAQASKYCADRLKDSDKIVNDVVRRITRGSR